MQMIVVGNAAYDGKQLMPNNALPVFAMQAWSSGQYYMSDWNNVPKLVLLSLVICLNETWTLIAFFNMRF
jgi:hypothetical protein